MKKKKKEELFKVIWATDKAVIIEVFDNLKKAMDTARDLECVPLHFRAFKDLKVYVETNTGLTFKLIDGNFKYAMFN